MFKQIDPRQDFIILEHEIIKFWRENNIVSKYLKKNQKSKKRWSFLDGPITANNAMGVHHAWGRTLKDLWQRYYTMKGYKQRYQNGFDCQGLWVEVEVEKELGFKSKKDIESYGIDKFVNKCKDRVLKFSKIQTDQSKRLAEWMDWDNSYYTMSEENNYTIWHFLKVCHEKGWIYQGTDSVPWCPRCATAISQHEILTEEYKELVHDSVFFRMPITKGKYKDYYLLVWTTTPWTIPANVALAIDPKKEYAVVEFDNKKLILLSKRVNKIFGNNVKIIKTLTGSDLIGLEYNSPFDDILEIKKIFGKYNYKIIESDELILPVSDTEGTGIVHIAPGAGSEDFRLGQKNKLPVLNVIDEEANYLSHMGYLASLNAKNNPEIIFNELKKKNNGKYLLKIEPYKHRYPTCWRCKTELVWRNVAEWYIAMDKKDPIDGKTFRQKMIETAKKINWKPVWGLNRELDWLNNMHDWLISKKRYWGLALPIWICDCGNFEVIGSKEELKKRAVKGWKEFSGHTPHKPWIDKVQIECSSCGKNISRILDVGNPWLDAGIVPFSTYIDPKTKKVSYLDDKKYWKEWFPAQFITECFPGQFKNWFYALIAMSTALENTNSYETLLGHALVFDEHGQEMHKSKGNAIWFDDAAEKMGVDVMRFMYSGQNPVQNLNFGYTPASEILRSFVLILWNSYSFFITYANVDGWDVKNRNVDKDEKKTLLDKWIISRLNQLIFETDKNLSLYQSNKVIEELQLFVKDLSTWYLRLSRKRRSNSFYETMYEVLFKLSLLLAPFMPHISEAIYQNLKTKNDLLSIHLCNWPLSEKKKIDNDILEKMENIKIITELGHGIRKETKNKVRQPLGVLYINSTKNYENELLELIKQELNVKKIAITEKFLKDEKVITKTNSNISVGLDISLNDELIEEGMYREIIRQIQFLRKKNGFKALDKIDLIWFSKSDKIIKILKKYQKEIFSNTLCSSISFDKNINIKKISVVKIGDEILDLAIK